jgi:hypothetical protein
MSPLSPSSVYTPFLWRHAPRMEALFDAWLFAAHDATAALRAWAATKPRDRATAHAVYLAALDREESAADALMVASRRRR